MIAVSMGLQYGVPPEVYVSKLSHMRFEPSGITNDEDIRMRAARTALGASTHRL
jgi:ribonucleoside-diphosphate reductase alpha chain